MTLPGQPTPFQRASGTWPSSILEGQGLRPRPRPAFCLALGLALAAVPAGAVRPITPPAPEFPPGRVWVNAKPLSMRLLRGKKAVLVAFINPGSVNSLRTLSVLREWWERYALEGLMVIGVQSPDYEFQKDPLVLQKSAKRLAIQFPLVLDNDRSIWKSYAVEGWPALFLVDHRGRIVYDRLGEGSYAEFEGEIIAAAERAGYKPSRSFAPLEDPPAIDCGTASETIFAGSARGKVKQIEDLMRYRNTVFVNTREGEAVYQGEWAVESDAMALSKDNKGRSFQVSFVYHGARAAALISPGRRAQRFYVLQDEHWIKPEAAGNDIRFDEESESFVSVDDPGVYDLVRNPTDDPHELIIIPAKAGARIYEISVSDRCLSVGL
ncbi:MAG: redoxin domain-containing protein [Elusimicrobia bacterium]|nr:redoxin domain-containing protein [Elusimicrobiota bacterium]